MGKDRLSNLDWLKQWVSYDGSECVEWPFGRWTSGYGVVTLEDGKRAGAHRAICELVHGPPPTDQKYVAAHSCGNRNCVNPNHIRWATHKENSEDMLDHGTLLRGSESTSAKLTERDVHDIRRRLQKGEFPIHIARSYGVHKRTITSIRRGLTWAWLETPGIKTPRQRSA